MIPRRASPTRASTRSWSAFEQVLTPTLTALDREILILEVKGTSLYVQVMATRRTMRAEAVSNAWLPKRERLDSTRIAALSALGWSSPTEQPGDEHVPKGSPNYSREFPMPAAAREVARLLIETLSGPFRVSTPDGLSYHAFRRSGGDVDLPALGLARRADPSERDSGAAAARAPLLRLRRQVLAELRRGTGDAKLTLAEDDCAATDMDGSLCWVGVIPAPLAVRAWTKLPGISATLRVKARIHQLNAELVLVRAIVAGRGVFASVDLPGAPFRPEHLRVALRLVAEAAPAIAKRLGTRARATAGTSKS